LDGAVVLAASVADAFWTLLLLRVELIKTRQRIITRASANPIETTTNGVRFNKVFGKPIRNSSECFG
jgi:hypothetical protein